MSLVKSVFRKQNGIARHMIIGLKDFLNHLSVILCGRQKIIGAKPWFLMYRYNKIFFFKVITSFGKGIPKHSVSCGSEIKGIRGGHAAVHPSALIDDLNLPSGVYKPPVLGSSAIEILAFLPDEGLYSAVLCNFKGFCLRHHQPAPPADLKFCRILFHGQGCTPTAEYHFILFFRKFCRRLCVGGRIIRPLLDSCSMLFVRRFRITCEFPFGIHIVPENIFFQKRNLSG